MVLIKLNANTDYPKYTHTCSQILSASYLKKYDLKNKDVKISLPFRVMHLIVSIFYQLKRFQAIVNLFTLPSIAGLIIFTANSGVSIIVSNCQS